MAKSSTSTDRKKSARREKAERQESRPFLHNTGRWAKKCRGKLIYLGYESDDPTGEAAWQRWLEIRDDAKAGRYQDASTPAKSTSRKKASRKKAERQDARPFVHHTGRWAKKCRGSLVYLGYVRDDPEGEAAWNHWLEIRDDARAGRPFRQLGQPSANLSIRDLLNDYLNAKRVAVKAGELSERSHRELRITCERIAKALGKTRSATDLEPADFERIRAEITKHCGPTRTKNEITRAKGVFRWAYKQGMIDKLPRYGAAFDPPTAKTLRLAKAAKGERLFTPDEIEKLLDRANVQQRAHVLLALNCGFGQSDVSSLPKSAIDLETGWIDFARVKTGIPRRCWLWPETREALAAAMAERVTPANPADEDRALLTRYGKPLVRHFKGAPEDTIAAGFRRLLTRAKLDGQGLSFYRLRHTHRHIADESGDQPAANYIMGHADGSMAAVYRGRVSDERLQRVAEVIRVWLFPPEADSQGEEPAIVKFPSAG